MIRIAVIGDIHRCFSEFDTRFFNASDYHLILLVGDLSNWWQSEGVEVASLISGLSKMSLFIPGNHDTINAFQLLAEVKKVRPVAELASIGQGRRLEEIQREINPVTVCGYSIHPFSHGQVNLDIIAARPFSMGGDEISSRRYLRQVYGVKSMDDSTRLLKKCVESTKADKIIFLAHNGPTGLGSRKTDIWGRDFGETGGDHGDPDLRSAIDHAQEQGKQVVAVVAGHMHRHIKGGGIRRGWVVEDGIHYINAAYVPRIFTQGSETIHHHVRLLYQDSELTVSDCFEEFSAL
jgi:uncharacterized protein (TIGR04168 family)